MQVLVLGRRVHRYIDRAQFSSVLALLASIEARDETSALVDRIEARHVYFFTLEEERSMQNRASADQQ